MNMPPRYNSFLYIEKYGGNKKLCLKRDGLERISDKLIPFLRDILLNLSELLPPKDEEENNIINILNQPICLNINAKRNGNCLLLKKYCYNGVFFIKQFLSYQEFQNKCTISTNILEYYGIVGAVPKEWENIFGRLHFIKNDIVGRLKSDKKACKYFYKLYLENIKESPVMP